MNNLSKLKKTELETLKTFKEEVPSIYFSATDDESYNKFSKNFEKTYRDLGFGVVV